MRKIFFIFTFFIFLTSCGGVIKKKGYRICIDTSFYPLKFEKLEKNVYGYVQELFLEIAKLKNVKFLIYKVNKDNLFPSLKKKKCVAILSSKQPYIFEKEKYAFSNSLLLTGPVLVLREGSEYVSLDDMDDKLVGFVKKSYIFLLEKREDILTKRYLNIPTALNDVRSKYLNAALIERIKGINFVNNIYSDLKVTKPITDEGLRLISLIENEEFIEFFNEAIEKLGKEGKLKELQKKWSLLF